MTIFKEEFTLSELMRRNNDNDDIENENTAAAMQDDWTKDRQAYEVQFNQLQEQLLAAMLENQQLIEQIHKPERQSLSELTKSLEDEKAKRKEAEERLKVLLERKPKISTDNNLSFEHDCSDLGFDLSGNKLDTNTDSGCRKSKLQRKLLEYKIHLWNSVHERLSDFVNDDEITAANDEEEEFSVRSLKENVNRFTDAIQPIKKLYNSYDDLLMWKNPWLTLTVFIIYAYSFYMEMAMPLFFFSLLAFMCWSYANERGIGKRFLRKKKKISEELGRDDQTSCSFSERYQLVLLIAKKVQNTLGFLSDLLEKTQNLLSWQNEEASKTLLMWISLLFVASVFFSTNTFFIIAGLLTGVSVFIVTPIYRRFPKVRKRYDDFQRLWDQLPNHKENVRRKIDELQEVELPDEDKSPPPERGDSSTSSAVASPNSNVRLEDQTHDAIVFCDRFALPITEAPAHEWLEGRRCTLMDKESPLTNMKHGRLYLTQRYLCFERNQFHSKNNIAIDLNDVRFIKKAKPLSFFPGMAIEVQTKTFSKPYLFGAMIGRDEAFDSIKRAGSALNLSWSKL